MALVLPCEQHIFCGQPFQPGGARRLPVGDLDLASTEGIEPVEGDSGQERVLVFEVMVGRACRDTGASGDCTKCDGVDVGIGDELEGRVDQRPAKVAMVLSDSPIHTDMFDSVQLACQDKQCSTHREGKQMAGSDASAVFRVGGRPVTVHALHSGTVTIKRSHARGCLPERSPSLLRLLAILADRRFAAPMPIFSYVVDHPEGLFVIDAGASPTYNDLESWRTDPRSRVVFWSFIRLDVGPGGALPDRLATIGLPPNRARAVVLTHQHIDHTGSIPAFDGVDVWTTRAEDAAADRIGALHWRWRTADTRIRHVDTEGEPGELGPTVALTTDGALQATCTPGHTPGSVTVRLRTDDTDVWFTGDTSFTAEHMNPSAPTAGIHSDMRAVRALQARLQDAGMLLPSHDPGVPARLREYRVGSGSSGPAA